MEKFIRQKLLDAFAPTLLDIENQSHLHQGHIGSPGSSDSHFQVSIKTPLLAGLSKVEQQRRVYAVLAEAFTKGLHALSLEINKD
jgi:BolA protein